MDGPWTLNYVDHYDNSTNHEGYAANSSSNVKYNHFNMKKLFIFLHSELDMVYIICLTVINLQPYVITD